MNWFLGTIGAIVVVAALWGFSTFQGLVGGRENTQSMVANVQVNLQAQANKIPALSREAVTGFHMETDGFERVMRARSAAQAAVRLNPADVANDPELQRRLLESQEELANAAGALNVQVHAVAEQYPQFQSVDLFRRLMDETAEAQNMITYSRTQWNESVRQYNTTLRGFPGVIIGRMFDFQPAAYFSPASELPEMPELPLGDN